jgi:hypothetical protein
MNQNNAIQPQANAPGGGGGAGVPPAPGPAPVPPNPAGPNPILIPVTMIPYDVLTRLVPSQRNPACSCGKYQYYSAICGHVVRTHTHHCHNSGSVTTNSQQCPNAAPVRPVRGALLNIRCPDCS